MSEWQYFLLLVFIVAGAAVASKPHHSTFDEVFTASVKSAFESPVPFRNKALTEEISDLGCSTASDRCAPQIRRGLRRVYRDFIVAHLVNVEFDDHAVAACAGIANSWFCWEE